jgi:hypothetical protein
MKRTSGQHLCANIWRSLAMSWVMRTNRNAGRGVGNCIRRQ